MFAIAKRVMLFLLVNIFVMTTVSILWAVLSSVFQLPPSTYGFLITYCVVFGFGGALVSLALSRVMAKWMMGVQVIDPSRATGLEKDLVMRVARLAAQAGLPQPPEVGIYRGEEVNAFATGPSKRRSLVAVSTGLLQRLNDQQVEGVLGHEIGHIANGDMVTMTLIQGVVNAVVMIIARIVAMGAASQVEERNRYWVEVTLVLVLQILLSLLGSLVVNYFSRQREFRADAWGARLAGRAQMVSALRALAGTTELVDSEHQALATLKISGKGSRTFAHLFSTHPSIEERVKRLLAS